MAAPNVEWAQSLVGRDWEIFWNESDDGGQEDGIHGVVVANDDDDDVTISRNNDGGSPQTEPNRETTPAFENPMEIIISDKQEEDDGNASTTGNQKKESQSSEHDIRRSKREVKKSAKLKDAEENSADKDDDSEGSVIDDWYAARVISFESTNEGSLVFKVSFVGEEEVYDMDTLDSSKLRPSAIGWIKRARALLENPCVNDEWFQSIPPDTSMLQDRPQLEELKKRVMDEVYEKFDMSGQTASTLITNETSHIQRIQHLRFLLQAQIYLRSRVAKIVNHHGSSQFVDGEPNPTETYVEHLVSCLSGLEKTCAWYCSCWKLVHSIATNFTAGEPYSIDKVIEEHLEQGRNSILYCLDLNPTPTAAGKRKGPSPLLNAGASRRTKRRKKNRRLDGVTQEEDDLFSIPSGINEIVEVLEITGDGRWGVGWCLIQFGRMLSAISKVVVKPALEWQRQASLYLAAPFDDALYKELNEKVNPQTKGQASEENGIIREDPESDEMSVDDGEQPYTYEEIEACWLHAQNDPVVNKFQFTDMVTKLQTKLDDIRNFQQQAEIVLRSLMDESESLTKLDDIKLNELQRLVAEANKPDSSCYLVEPIGQKPSSITKEMLTKAYELRLWLLDLQHAESVRERPGFARGLSQRAEDLAAIIDELNFDTNEIQSKWQAAHRRIAALSGRYLQDFPICEKYYKMLIDITGDDDEPQILITLEEIDTALQEFQVIPYLSLAEELLTVRRDIIEWFHRSETLLKEETAKKPAYDEIEALQSSLNLVSIGKSQTRSILVEHIEFNSEVEIQVQAFAGSNIKAICGKRHHQVVEMFKASSGWKERADSVVSALVAHGNTALTRDDVSQKATGGMVDIRRIHDLLGDYDNLGVEFSDTVSNLRTAYEEAQRWKLKLEERVIKSDESFSRCLDLLLEERETRPRGMIMEPTRSTYDGVVDLLTWYKHVKNCFRDLSSDEPKEQDRQLHLSEKGYPLLLEGSEIVLHFATNNTKMSVVQDTISSYETILGRLRNFRKSSKHLSMEKLKGSPLGTAIVERMVKTEVDIEEGGALHLMSWVLWHGKVVDFTEKCANSFSDQAIAEKPPVYSLADALALKSQEPTSPTDADNTRDIGVVFKILNETKTTELKELDRLISDAKDIEASVRKMLSMFKDSVKNSLEKQATIRSHLAKLKDFLSTIKARLKGGNGLSLPRTIEPPLELQIKMFVWLIKTFPYPMLYLDEATYATSNESSTSMERIPWDVLIGLYERIPGSVQDRIGDFALVILRITELYEAAKSWQDEITKNTMLSFRGGKRRVSTGTSPTKRESEEDNEQNSQVALQKVEQLAKNPILSRVMMPREDAVSSIHQTSNKFETHLHDFLGKDFNDPDRTPYPESNSLVGERGEFILYKLTGSPIYVALRSAIHSISMLSEKLLAETPGKAAFEWIYQAAEWIEKLNESVTLQSPFEKSSNGKLVIPSNEAKKLLKEGEGVFLQVPEDLRRTISAHGIFMSTNKQGASLRVVFKKDGAHHSVGGTTLRWCPLLFDCLRNDVSALDEWENEMKNLLARFRQFHNGESSHLQTEPALLQWHEFRSRLSDLIMQGRETLVVSPSKTFVDSFNNLLSSMDKYVAKYSTKQINDKFERARFEDGTSLVEDRLQLLESLLRRQRLLKSSKAYGLPGVNDGASVEVFQARVSFRDTCRNALDKSLQGAAALLGMDGKKADLQTKQEFQTFCALRAWQIENALFERFQQELGTTRVSNEYRDKARTLRYNFEDKNNLTLSPRVLIGEIPVAKLVSMTPEQLASQKRKLARAKAEEYAQQQVMLTKPTKKSGRVKGGSIPTKPDDPKVGNVPTKKDDPKDGNNSVNVASATPKKDSPISDAVKEQDLQATNTNRTTTTTTNKTNGDGNKAKAVEDQKIEPMHIDDDECDGAPTLDDDECDGAPTLDDADDQMKPPPSVASGKRSGSEVPKARTQPPPPPPPSLARVSNVAPPPPPPALAMGSIQPLLRDRGKRIVSSSGSDRFKIEVSGKVFYSHLFSEGTLNSGTDGFLPEVLKDKGRLRIDEFVRFLSDKLRGGRWKSIPLRLMLHSDVDSQQYKRFYKEYEMKKRIAMFSITQNTKLFLLTPKFHGAISEAGLRMPMASNISTYAVVLTKEV